MSSKLFLRGVPVGPDVDKLIKAFGPLARDGKIITHGDMEKVLGINRLESRYRTVLTAFRKRVWDLYEVALSGRRAIGQGYRCLTANEVVEEAQKAGRATTKRTRQALIEVTSMPDIELSPDHLALKRKYLALTEGVLQRHLAADAILRDKVLLSA